MQSFIEQMCDNVRTSLLYPYHMDCDKIVSIDGVKPHFNPECEVYHVHSFEDVLRQAYRQPKAFYLKDEDLLYYSDQEIDLIQAVVERESKKIDEGYEMVTLEIDEETDALLEQYCAEHKMTFEEGVIDILTKFVETYKSPQDNSSK